MTPDQITQALCDRFGEAACQQVSDDAWQVEAANMRLLAIRPGSWLKLMIPLMPAPEAQPFMAQMMEANFDQTQQTRYAIHQDVVWGVFQYDMESLELLQFQSAIDQLQVLKSNGVDELFSLRVEAQVTQIIIAAKKQGQTLEATMKMLDRFYAEGMMGEMGSGSEQKEYQNDALTAWRRQLERLWPTVDVEG